MLQTFGLYIQPLISAGNIITWGLIIGAALIWWIRGAPERRRAENEAKIIDNTEAALLRSEYQALHQKNRDDYHALANDFQKLVGTQKLCEKRLAEAHAENRGYRDDMRTLLFLARLLIKEIRRLDPNPDNIIIDQAEMTLAELESKNEASKPVKSLSREAAEETLHAAERTVEVMDKTEGAGT